MSGKDGVSQIIKAFVTVVTLIALTGWFRVIKATLDDLCRLTRGACHAVGPAQLADGLITLHLIDEILPTATLDLAFCLSPLSVRKRGLVMTLLHPGD